MHIRSNRRSGVMDRPHRPGLFALVGDILHGTLSGILSIPVLLIAAATLALYMNQLPYLDLATTILLGTIVLGGLWRGCADWQQQRADYQRKLAHLRRRALRQEAATEQEPPGFIPFYNN